MKFTHVMVFSAIAFFSIASLSYANLDDHNKCVDDCVRYVPDKGPSQEQCIRNCGELLTPRTPLGGSVSGSSGGGKVTKPGDYGMSPLVGEDPT